jgi:endonuclease/exonuclease/phosphatase family metal-dependent hydrolase
MSKFIRFATAAAISLALLTFSAALFSGCAAGRDQAATRTFRVMTYNIHHGEGVDGKVDLPRIAEVIKRERADIVALQEVDRGVERTGRRDLPAELAALTGMTCFFSNNFHFQGGEYGNAVLTRFPVKRLANTHFVKVNEVEQRGMLQVTLDLWGSELVFMVTHLDYRPDDAARWSNVGEIETLAKQYRSRPVMLCGDFNDVSTNRVCRRLNETFDDTWALAGQSDGFTIPAQKPRKRIDYIWISKDKSLVPLKARVPQSDASDHLPVVGEFRFAK